MELCVFVLALLSLVRASPYGYGVKGGAVAKAEANAAAGSFGGFGVPLVIPAGGYSGSYSKSSASSFASSSSGASSSSFSYSGGNSGGYASAGGSSVAGLGNGGCSSNDCSENSSGSNGHDVTSGQGGSYSAAHAAAGAGSLAGLSSHPLTSIPQGCSNGDCTNNQNLLGLTSSGSINSNTSNDQSSEYNEGSAYKNSKLKPKCNTPNCGTYVYNSNNAAPVNTPSEAGGVHVPGIHLTTPTKSPQDQLSCNDSFCENTDFNHDDVGNDENLPSSYNVPSYTVTASDLEAPSCSSGYCNTNQGYNNPTVNIENKPLTKVPDKKSSGTKCFTHDCSNASDDIVVKKNHHNVIPPSQQTSSQCKTGNCDHYPSLSPSTRPIYDSTIPSNSLGVTSHIPQDCGSSNCGSSQPHFTENIKPNYSSTPFPSFNFASAGSTAHSAAFVPSSAFSSPVKPSGGFYVPSVGTTTNYKPSSNTNPSYYNPSAGTSYNTQLGTTTYNSPTAGSISYNPASGSTFVTPLQGYNGHNPTVQSQSYHNPSAEPNNYYNPSINAVPSSGSNAHTALSTSNSLPSNVAYIPSNTGSTSGIFSTSKPIAEYPKKPVVYTGGFGGPPGYLKPNDYSSPSKSASAQQRPFVQQPYYTTTTTTVSPTAYIPLSVTHGPATGSNSAVYTGGFGGSTGLLSSTTTSFDEHAHHIAEPNHKPNAVAGVSATSTASVYTGGFGGPAGFLKPNDYSLPTNPIIAQQRPFVQQPYSSSTSSTVSPNVSTAKISSPAAHTTVSASTSALYSGGFGGPSGLLAPSVSSSGKNLPHLTNPNHTPNTAASASATSNAIVYTGGSNAHTALSTSNSLPSNVAYIPSNTGSTSGIFSTSKPIAEYPKKPVVYTGGFGGPPGYLKPNDYSSPSKPASAQQRPFVQQPYYTTTTTTVSPTAYIPLSVTHGPATGSNSAVYTGGFGGSTGLLSSTTTSFDEHAHHIAEPNHKPNAIAGASATSTASVYTGGFGGPAGFLKPNDYSLPTNPIIAQQRPFVQQPYSSSTSSTVLPNVSTAKISSPAAHTTVSASTSALYSGGFGGPSGLLAPSVSSSGKNLPHLINPNHTPNTAASASATSNAIVYTGSFGGPPGFLKPYDSSAGSIISSQGINDGTHSKGLYSPSLSSGSVLAGASASAQGGANAGTYKHGNTYGGAVGCKDGCDTSKTNIDSGDYSLYGANASTAAEADAVSGFEIGAYNSGYDYSNDANHGVGCKDGCSSGNGQIGYAHPNSGNYAGISGGFGVAQATAKSIAGAAAGAGAYGLGGSFASSSASAHASAGTHTKGGYGRK